MGYYWDGGTPPEAKDFEEINIKPLKIKIAKDFEEWKKDNPQAFVDRGYPQPKPEEDE